MLGPLDTRKMARVMTGCVTTMHTTHVDQHKKQKSTVLKVFIPQQPENFFLQRWVFTKHILAMYIPFMPVAPQSLFFFF